MKKSLLLVLPLLFPVLSLAQTPVFRCEVDGRVVWSDNPCKSKGKVVTIKPLKTQPAKNDNAPKPQPK